MSYHRIFYGNTPEEANTKAQAFYKTLDRMQQPSISKPEHAPAKVTFMPDGSVINRSEGKFQVVVHYWGLD